MNTASKKIIDMTQLGEIYDENGYQDCTKNLADVLNKTTTIKNAKSYIFKILVSKVRYNDNEGNHPFRYSKEKKVNLKKLKELRKDHTNEDFSETSYEKYIKKELFEHEHMEKKGAARAAWGLSVNIGNQIREIQEEQNFQKEIYNLPIEEQKQAIRKRKESDSGPIVYMG